MYEPATTALDQAISQVCTEIMASSINILYKSTDEILKHFHKELRSPTSSVNCEIFFEYFAMPINCDKLFTGSFDSKVMNVEIFKLTSQLQKAFTLRMLLSGAQAESTSGKQELAASKFMRQYAQRALMSYVDLLKSK